MVRLLITSCDSSLRTSDTISTVDVRQSRNTKSVHNKYITVPVGKGFQFHFHDSLRFNGHFPAGNRMSPSTASELILEWGGGRRSEARSAESEGWGSWGEYNQPLPTN